MKTYGQMMVRDLMTTDVITVDEGDDLDLAQSEMSLARIRHLPVVRKGRLVGLVTHRDILEAMCSVFADIGGQQQAEFFRSVAVTEIMASRVRTVEPDTDASEAARTLLESKIGCLPVVDDGDRLVGIVTEADFVELSRQLLDKMRDHDLDDEVVEAPQSRYTRGNDEG